MLTPGSSGRLSPTGQTRRRGRQLQRSPRSKNEEHPSLTSKNGAFRLLGLRPRASPAGSPTLRLTSIQHPHKIPNTAAGLPELEPRHPEPGSLILLFVAPRRLVGPAAPHDGRSATDQQLHQHAWRCHHGDRTDHQ